MSAAVSYLDGLPEPAAPFDLWQTLPPVPPLPVGIVPTAIEQLALAKPSVFSPSAVAAAALATCSMASSDLITLEINQTWRERYCIWVGLAGASSAAKSPTMKLAMRPLRHVEAEEAEKFHKLMEEWQAREKAAKKAREEFDEPKPVAKRYLSNNATIEALSEVLKSTEHGIGIVHDELSALIAAMDGSYKEKSGGERGNWLALYDGGAHQTDRVMRGSVYVKNHSAAILGAITTDKLRTFVSSATADGLMSRIALSLVPVAAPSDDLDAVPHAVYREYEAVVKRIAENRPTKPYVIALSADGKAVLGAAQKKWQSEAALCVDTLPRFAERLGKLPGYAARIVLGFAIIDAASDNPSTYGPMAFDLPKVIGADLMQRAVAYVEHQATHDLAFYSLCAGQETLPAMTLARKVGGWILQHARAEFRLGDITRGVREWRDVRGSEQAAALELLEALAWINAEVSDAGPAFRGQSFVRGTVWRVNPAVHDMYRTKAESIREAAKAAKERLAANVAAHTQPEEC